MKAICAMVLTMIVLAGCTSKAAEAPPAQINEASLKGQRYVLGSINGKQFTSEFSTPELEFAEEGVVFGRACNQFRGKGSFTGNVFTAPQVAATMMLCPDAQLNELERNLFSMLREGATVTLEGKKLTLAKDENILEYIAAER